MPHKNYTCITIHKREYEKLKALAEAKGLSVRDYVLLLFNREAKILGVKLRLETSIDLLLLNIRRIKIDAELLRKILLDPPEYLKKHLEKPSGREVYEYYKARFLKIIEILDTISEIEQELNEISNTLQH